MEPTTASDTARWVISLDPIALDLWVVQIRWYALAYIVGLVLGWQYINMLLRTDRLWARADVTGFPRETRYWKVFGLTLPLPRLSFGPEIRRQHQVAAPARTSDIDDLLVWATLGVILGGRLGYILFYALWYESERPYYLENPLRIFYIWEGGMAFHGGLIGVVLAIVLFARRRDLNMVRIGDLAAVATPIGLFFGRIANFVNGELWGKVTDSPLGVVFMTDVLRKIPYVNRAAIAQEGDPETAIRTAIASGDLTSLGIAEPLAAFVRHPSQLYEALLEGAILFVVLYIAVTRFRVLDRPGFATGLFFIGYALGRGTAEFWRETTAYVFSPDHWFTVGMLLSLPMIAVGLCFIAYALHAGQAIVARETPKV